MTRFIGRERELASLSHQLERVATAPADEPAGRCLLVRGRRRVGKSRLVEELCRTTDVPSLYFTASQQGDREVGLFVQDLVDSDLPGRGDVAGLAPQTWDAALRLLANVLEGHGPAIVVFDEFPYLVDDDPTVEATFQKHWDRTLSRLPVLLVLIGSDLAMMEALNTHGRAFFQRGVEMIVPPLSPAETGTIVGSGAPADTFDAYLVTGGLPLICDEWQAGVGLWEYLEGAVADSTSALIVSAERTLAAEFPAETQSRAVLAEIGSGERTFTNIARAAGGLQAASLSRSLAMLTDKRIVAREVPLSTRASKEARYRVADPYLRFWLTFIGPYLHEIERGRGDRVLDRMRRGWPAWRGRAIEPVVREALARLGPLPGLDDAPVVGGYWTRTNSPEVDLIGADRGPVASAVRFAGAIKWREESPFNHADLARLATDAMQVPGVDDATPLVAVSRTDVTATGVVALGPDDLLSAW